MHPYSEFVNGFARLMEQGKRTPLGSAPKPAKPPIAPDAPKALIFSPHPDDEAIVGGLPLRLLRESRMNVINVAVTQGSNKARQQERWNELKNCCDYIGFGLIQTAPNGLEGINLKTRSGNPGQWSNSVKRVAEILREQQPQIIFFPHSGDWNSSHIGTHYLVVDALGQLGHDFRCTAIENEFWGAMADPNLMVESTEEDVSHLITGLTFHVGEVARNPYHLRMPAWLMDNVRRGAEIVGGQGGAAPEFLFGTLYRVSRWQNGRFEKPYSGGKFLTRSDAPSSILS